MSDDRKLKILQRYMLAQKKTIEEYKWKKGEEQHCDPGSAAVLEWIDKFSKKYRKDFILNDLKDGLVELKHLRNDIHVSLENIQKLLKVIDDCEEKIIEGFELLETDSDK